jgi:hypothetical protein
VDEVATDIAADPASAPSERRAANFTPDERAEPESGNVNADGALKLSLTSASVTAKTGQKLTYFLEVANDRAVSDRDLAIRIVLPEGLAFSKLSGRFAPKISDDQRIIDIPPILEVRPREKLPAFQLEVVAKTPGKKTIHVEARCQRSPTAVTADLETTVF